MSLLASWLGPLLVPRAVGATRPEKWYYVETQNEQNGLKRWLQARTTGLCMAWSRLLRFHVVRSTRAVIWTAPRFVDDGSAKRTDNHRFNNPAYPDPWHYLSYIAKFLFRHPQLRELRIEQFNRRQQQLL